MKSVILPISKLIVLPDVERPADAVADDLLRKSIEASQTKESNGIQQPFIGVEDGPRILLVDGLRRRRIAPTLGITKVWCIVDKAPKGDNPEEYVRRLRFILDHHRQDLMPSQKAELIETLKRQFGLSQKQCALYLGVDEDSITNWLAVRQYVPEIVAELDQGTLTMKAARPFRGLSAKGQRHVWKEHGSDLAQRGGGNLHKTLRAQYPPTKFPDFYKDPQMARAQLTNKSGPRKSKPRPSLSKEEKSRLLNSFEVREASLKKLQKEEKQLTLEIRAATPIIAAIMRNEKLLALVPKDMREELEVFAAEYC